MLLAVIPPFSNLVYEVEMIQFEKLGGRKKKEIFFIKVAVDYVFEEGQIGDANVVVNGATVNLGLCDTIDLQDDKYFFVKYPGATPITNAQVFSIHQSVLLLKVSCCFGIISIVGLLFLA
uniref:Uncharacterized protein n=1 Tax=Lactuca sativa TaxID=4236 RepID=A0A9R1WKE5_LACSA|nr:hypothetical protein LSAT_V11C100024360 [Lactuca sativa]